MMKRSIRFVLALLFIVFAPAALAVDGVPMYITVPVNPIYDANGDPGTAFEEQTIKTLDLAKGLGVTGVRFVVWWEDLYPDTDDVSTTGVIDDSARAAYMSFLAKAMGADYNLRVILVLYGWPYWAAEEYDRFTKPSDGQTNFWTSWQTYVSTVVAMSHEVQDILGFMIGQSGEGQKVPYPDYQIWNNANSRSDPISSQDDPYIIYTAGKAIGASGLYSFTEDGGNTSTSDGSKSTNKRIVNVNADVMRWEHAMSDWIGDQIDQRRFQITGPDITAGPEFDVIAVNNDPSLMNLSLWTDWGPVKDLLKNINEPDDSSHSWNGKGAMVLGTSHSTWNVFVSNEAEQSLWMDTTFPALRRAMTKTMNKGGDAWRKNKRFLMKTGVTGVVYNDLIDEQGRTFWPEISGHLGVVKRPNLNKKLGYHTLKRQVKLMQEQQPWQKD